MNRCSFFRFLLVPFFAIVLRADETNSVVGSLTAVTLGPAIMTVKVRGASVAAKALSPEYAGLSYESSMLLPVHGRHYFDPSDKNLIQVFKTLGVKNLRVGANAVDDPQVAVPNEKDIDSLFTFAREAGVKVIYSFRLKNGDPSVSARLAKYIVARYPYLLDCFAIGNEPEFFNQKQTFGEFLTLWKPHRDAIVAAVPDARIEGPSAVTSDFANKFAQEFARDPHLAKVTQHFYVFGDGRQAEKKAAMTRAKIISNSASSHYAHDYLGVAGKLATNRIAYRIDEMNNCYNGGAKGVSDAYASALWALEWLHWWASKGIDGMNFHTGEKVGMNGSFHAPNYASFIRVPGEEAGFEVKPIGYGLATFAMGVGQVPVSVDVRMKPSFDGSAYAYAGKNGEFTVTVLNKSHDQGSRTAQVDVILPKPCVRGSWKRLDLSQSGNHIAATSGITIGGAGIGLDGIWKGVWRDLGAGLDGSLKLTVPPATAAILKFTP
jgi:hypothetical protein